MARLQGGRAGRGRACGPCAQQSSDHGGDAGAQGMLGRSRRGCRLARRLAEGCCSHCGRGRPVARAGFPPTNRFWVSPVGLGEAMPGLHGGWLSWKPPPPGLKLELGRVAGAGDPRQARGLSGWWADSPAQPLTPGVHAEGSWRGFTSVVGPTPRKLRPQPPLQLLPPPGPGATVGSPRLVPCPPRACFLLWVVQPGGLSGALPGAGVP